MKLRRHIIALLLLPAVFCACRRELVRCDVNYANIEVRLDWSAFGETPDDATVIFYPNDDTKYTSFVVHGNTQCVKLQPGKYSAVAFNQKPGDFDGIDIVAIDRYETIRATLKEARIEDGCMIYKNPDKLGVDSEVMIEVTQEMVEHTRRQIETNNECASATIWFRPENVVQTSTITVFIKNLCDARAFDARVNGIARGISFSTLKRDNNSAAQRLENVSAAYSPGSMEDGKLRATILSFGMRDDSQGAAQDVELCIKATLVDEDQTSSEWLFGIGDRIEDAFEDSGEVIIGAGDDPNDNPIILPDVEPGECEEGAFNPGVDPWGPEENVDIDFSKKQ